MSIKSEIAKFSIGQVLTIASAIVLAGILRGIIANKTSIQA